MQALHVPRPSLRFWLLITVASVFGADLGDFCSHVLGLGHWRGAPILAAIFAALLLTERAAGRRTELFYWLAVLTLRTAATNLADLATHDFKLADGFVLTALALPLLVLAFYQDRSNTWLDPSAKPRIDARYWCAMLLASIFGTALGDTSADLLQLLPSTLVWLGVWAIGAGLTARLAAPPALLYWTIVCIVRTLGTNIGDLTAGHEGLALGLPLATSLSGLAFLALYAIWRPARVPFLEQAAE